MSIKSMIAQFINKALLVLALVPLCVFASQPNGWTGLAAQTSSQPGVQPTRKTSTPYKGDLEIFERKDRDQKKALSLQ